MTAKKSTDAGGGDKSAWFDEKSNAPLIQEHARRLDSFLAAVADESHQLIFEDKAMANVIALAEQVAPLDLTGRMAPFPNF